MKDEVIYGRGTQLSGTDPLSCARLQGDIQDAPAYLTAGLLHFTVALPLFGGDIFQIVRGTGGLAPVSCLSEGKWYLSISGE